MGAAAGTSRGASRAVAGSADHGPSAGSLTAIIGRASAPPASRNPLRDGPPAAHTGGFEEPTCHACHSFYDLGEGTGRLELMGLPADYEPGRRYPLEVSLHHDGMRVGGFELAVRFADGPRTGKQAGTIEPADSGSAITDSLGVQYLHHVRRGTTAAEPGSITWRFVWIAPPEPGAVRFDIAANASDDDNSELGDYIYVRSVESGEFLEVVGENGGGRIGHHGGRRGR